MIRNTLIFVGLAAFVLSCGSNSSETTTEASPPGKVESTSNGKDLYAVCVACHGADAKGNVTLNAPALVNMEDWYLERQINNFRNGIRGNDPSDMNGYQMASMAKTLQDEEAVKQVVSYIKTLPVVVIPSTIEGDIAKGKQLYAMTCGACHGPNAEGNKMLNAPNLAGINDWYLKGQYNNFKEGIRGSHPDDLYGAQMMAISQSTVLENEQALNDLIAFIISNNSAGSE